MARSLQEATTGTWMRAMTTCQVRGFRSCVQRALWQCPGAAAVQSGIMLSGRELVAKLVCRLFSACKVESHGRIAGHPDLERPTCPGHLARFVCTSDKLIC